MLKILALILAAILTARSELRNRGNEPIKIKNVWPALIVIAALIFSIFSEIQESNNKATEASLRNEQYDSTMKRADTTLRRVDSNLHISDSTLANTFTSITSLSELQQKAQHLADSLKDQLILQREINQDTKSLLVKSNQATNLLIQNLDEQTGGNNFCYVDVILSPDWNQDRSDIRTASDLQSKLIWREMMVLRNNGNFSLRNVHIEIQKPYVASEHSRYNLPIYDWIVPPLKNEYFIANHSQTIIYEGLLPDTLTAKSEIIYDVHFFLGNGNQYTQVIKLAKAHGGWPEATRIVETTDTAYKFEFVHPLYPNKPVNWNYLRPLSNTFRQ